MRIKRDNISDIFELILVIGAILIGVIIVAISVLIVGFVLLWPIFGNISLPPKALADYLSCWLYGTLAVWLIVDKIEYNKGV